MGVFGSTLLGFLDKSQGFCPPCFGNGVGMSCLGVDRLGGPSGEEDREMVTLDQWSVVEEVKVGAQWAGAEESFAASAALSPTGRFAFVGRDQTITAYSLQLSIVDECALDSRLLAGSRIAETVMNPDGTSLAIVVADSFTRWVTFVDLPESLWDKPEPKDGVEGDEPAHIARSTDEGATSGRWLVGGLIVGGFVIAASVSAVAVGRRRSSKSTP
jgi:hypothetical protein